MPIFDNELIDNVSDRNYNDGVDRPLGSAADAFEKIDSEIGLAMPGQYNQSFQGITAQQARRFKGSIAPGGPNAPFSMVSKSELVANQRYPLYERGVNLENIYGLQQSGLAQLGNGLIKMGAFALGTFGQSFATIPNTIKAAKNMSLRDLSNPDGYEASVDNWIKNVEDYFPNYVTDYERSRGLATAIPFTYGSANFWGDKILKNSGFMVGAIAGAVAQDAIIGAVTEGVGAIPLVGVQIGKASLYLNKLFAGANKVDRVLDLAKAAGKSGQTLLNIERMGQLAAATKLTNGFRYGMSIYGSARTEAAIESRESYRTIKEQLTEQYRLDNYGEDPTPETVQQIEDYATDAMNTRFGINMALLTVSNAVQFGNLFKTFTGAERGLTSSALKDFGSAGKVGLKEGTFDVFEKKLPQTFSGKAWEFARPKAINVFTEGVYEEGGQFATQVGVEDYYTRKYKAQGKESWDFVKEAMASTSKGMAEQFGSSEGIESMVIGAITAAITGPIVDRVTGKSKQDNQRLNSTLNILNQYGMTGVLSDKYEDTSRSVEIAKQMNEAVNSGNIFKFKNLKADMFFGFVNSRIPVGMHDVTIEQLKMLKDLPKDEFEKTFGMDFNSSNQKTVSGYVDALIKRADSINDITTSLNSTFNNPYSRIIDPKTDDEKAESLKHSMFENWKTDLSNFSYTQQDSDRRIADIQTAISQVNPLLTNDLLTLATSEKGLKELSDIYEQKANLLSESLANLSPAERTARRNEIKKLRTLSEKISIALNSKNVDPKLFNELLNFELAGQDFSQPNALRIDESTGLTPYAEDLNKIEARKKGAAEKFDDLSSEKGFDKYFAEEEERQKETIDVDYVDISNKYKFTNKNNKEEALEVNREYQIPNISPAKIRKTGDQFKVTSPNGEVKYYDTREEAKQAADDLNVDLSELTTIKVIALNDDGTIKVEDLAGNIQNINSSLLKGYEKLQTEEEKLAKDKETLDKQQQKLEQYSATVVTINPSQGNITGSEEQKKDASILYLSTSTPSEDTAGEVKNKLPHVVRARKFLNNLKFFKNKGKYKVIIVTPNNAKELGLEGIVQLSYEKNITEPLTTDQTNVELGFMAQVFILQTPEGDFFVNEKGETISKVGDENPTILDTVIFETMTSAKLFTAGGYVKIQAGQEAEAERALEAYKIFRAEVFKQKGYTPYSFDISRGIPRKNTVNGVQEDNNVEDILGDDAEDIIANTEGLIQVVTTGKVSHKGQLLSYDKGVTLIQYGDLLDYVNNKNLTNAQATSAFGLIEAIAKEMITQSNTGKPVKINYAYSNFLQNILYWTSKADTKTDSQIGIDTTNMTFKIGDKAFPLSKISERKQEVMDALQNAFITVNNTTLKLGPSKKFTEYRDDKDGNITKVEWVNYQSYLLSGKNPDGSKRSTQETPLITHTAAPTQTQPSYKQKYSYITDGNVLPYDKIPPKPAPAPTQPTAPAAPGGVMIGKYELNSGKEQTFGEFKTGDVVFTGKVSPQGYVSVEIKTNETITKLSTEPQLVAAVDSNLRALPGNIVTIDLDKSTNEEKAKLFVKIKIESELGKQLEEQGSKPASTSIPEEVYEAFTEEAEESRQQSIDEEQARLEGEAPYNPSKRKRGDNGPSEFRMVGVADEDRMTNAEFEIFKAWADKNVPGIPFEDLDRMIQVNDTEQAWGVFEEGVAKFVRGGLKGTEYHEIFEGIWASFLSESEREAILNEFRNQEGQFTDRQSGKVYDYSDPAVTDRMAKERIADDFADFRLGKIKAKSLLDKIKALFNRIMKFFKTFGTKPSLKESLFKAIDSGKYKEAKISERVKSLAPEYRAVPGLTEQQTNDYVQDMVAQMKLIIFQEGRKDLLFNPEKMSGADVLTILKSKYEELGEIDALGENRYNQLVKRSLEFLKTIGVTINADEVVSINDEERTGKEYAQDPFSTDWKKYSTGALKFLLSTLTERNALNQTNVQVGTKLQPAEEKLSDIGFKLLNFNRVFTTLMDKLHNTNDVDVFIEKLIQLAKEDANYLPLFRALGGDLETHTMDFPRFEESDWRLFIQFFNTFSRQKPEAVIQYTSEDLKVYSAPANIFTIINQTVDGWVDNMKVIGKGRGGLITFARQNQVYRINTAEILNIKTKSGPEQLAFLSKIGIEFPVGTYEGLSTNKQLIKGKKSSELDQFINAVASIQAYLGKNNELMTFDAKKLGIEGPLRTLAELYVNLNNPNKDSTYFGVEGQRISSFAENDALSYFENDFNESKTLDELLEKRPELKDVFSKGSQILKKGGLFFDKDGIRIAEIHVEYIQGNKNAFTGKNKTTARLELGDRFIQEMNQNLNGKYYVLIPGDSSTEWMMNLGNVISMDDILEGKYWDKVNTIYSGYLEDEINLALENRQQNKYVRDKAQELRFMRDLLPTKIVEKIEKMIEDDTKTFADIQKEVSENKEAINAFIKSTFESISEDTFNVLLNNRKIIEVGENEYMFMGLDTEFMNKYRLTGDLSKDQVMDIINFLNLNYEINNIEYHKFIFGDPYQFKTEKGKLDETKRIKSFLSPRRRTFDHPEFNNFLKRTYNSVDGIALEKGVPGSHEYKSHTNTATFSNVNIIGSIALLPNVPQEIRDVYAKVDESDAMSWLMDNTHKEIALKEGQWSPEAEAFHQWQMAYTRQAFLNKNLFKTKELKEAYENSPLNKRDAALIKKDIPKFKLAIRKPIVSGNKANKTEIDLVLDKTSQMPLYYHMVEGNALEKMYLKMFDQEIGYGIVVSGRKVGVETPHDIYVNGKFNEAPIENIIEVPWSIYGTQVETMSEGEKTQTRGSQLTKIASMDLYNNGEPSSPEAKEAYEENTKFLNLLNENAYNTLLEKLGVEDLDGEFVMADGSAVSATLMGEMLRRALSENAKDTIELDPETQQFLIPFEASPSYLQIKSILYSLVNNALVSPKMSGAPHVQAPVTMFEKATEGRDVVRKIDGQWKKITRKEYEALTEEEKKGVVLTDSTLKFYTRESPYCEVMLPSWFKNQLKIGKFKDYTDDQLIDYLNKTPDGKKILSGIGFRIPTQALSSVEVFRVKSFLPEYMGYTVVVPSEITTKAGSDFDIDKLNIYLKSIYLDENGEIKLVSYKGSEQATKDFYAKVWENTIQKDIDRIEKYDDFRSKTIDILTLIERASREGISDIGELMTNDQIDFFNYHYNLLQEMIDQAAENNLNPSDYIAEQQETLNENKNELILKQFNEQLKSDYVKKMYKKALENEYYASLEKLLTLEENFNRLINPTDDAGLEDMSEVLDDAKGYDEGDVKARLINRNYMTNLRHAFITGKRWVGIAAVNITNLSLRQKSKVYLDPTKVALLNKRERSFVKDLSIVLPHNIVDVDGKKYISLSGTMTEDGTQLISQRLSGYATAFVDITNKPFITKIVKSDVVVSTFMFLEAIGAGNTGIYFLNQPIIDKYLEYLDSKGSKNVMSSDDLSYIKSLFPTTEQQLNNTTISVSGLLKNIEEYGEKQEFDQKKNAEQHLILDEFVKYKILADQLFAYTQALNYDTTRFSSSDTYLKKEWGTINAANYNLISNVNDVLAKTFIGKLSELLSNSYRALGAVMVTENPKIKAYTLSTLKRYATKKYMSLNDYEKISNNIKNSFIDFVIQNNTTVREMIESFLVNSQTSIVNKLEQAKQKYPSNQLIQDLIPSQSNRELGAKTITLKTNVKDSYSENLYTGMMRELRDSKNSDLRELYDDLINVSILQGTSQSSISIRNIIPIEDYAAKIAPIFQQLQASNMLESFENAMFERNNFANPELFEEFKPVIWEPFPNRDTGEYAKENYMFDPITGEDKLIHVFPNFSIKGFPNRTLVKLSEKYNSFQLASDFIKVPKIIKDGEGKKFNVATGTEIGKADYAYMMSKGDFNLFDAYYYKKVYTRTKDEFGNFIPLSTYDEKTGRQYYYKLINVYGDGNRAVEMNTNFTPSVIDNGSMRIANETSDDQIVSMINPGSGKQVVPLPVKETPKQMVGESTGEPKGVKPAIASETTVTQPKPSTSVEPTIDVSREWSGDLKTRPVYTAEGVNTMRTEVANKDEHFGNPFSEAGYGDTIKVASIGDAVVAYKNWLTTNLEIVDRYTDADVKADPNKIYVFGDNTQRAGTGGQAQIRNNPNAIGIATKLAPSNAESAFMTDKDLTKNKAVIDEDIAKIKATGKDVVFPKDGLGTGLAKLKEKAPQTYQYLKQRLLEEFGFNNDTGMQLKSQQRAWILDQINQGKLDGATLLYAGKSANRGQGMHPTALAEVVEQLRSIQPTNDVKVISEDYGVVQAETNPSETKKQEFLNLIKPQIEAQTYKENVGKGANQMFHFGKMWSRVTAKAKPIKINSFAPTVARDKLIDAGVNAKSNSMGISEYTYAYHELNQNGNPLPSLSTLQPIINEIQNTLGIDMSGYDSVIGNIYQPNEFIFPHKDVTESKSAKGYPVVVYTMGANAGLGIVDNNKGKMTFANQYDDRYLRDNEKLSGYTNEVLTKDGTIYTFGLNGNGRFQLTHSTPINDAKVGSQLPITLPNGKVITNYTITLTFRRAADLEPGMPTTPTKIIPTQSSNSVKEGVAELFESNPELSNTVYEALGFNQELNLQDTWINYVIKKDNISKEEVLQRLETHKPKMITVYRGEGSTVNLENSNLPEHVKKSKGRWFTKDKEVAKQYAEAQKGSLYALQIPETLFNDISKELNLENTNGVEALLPQELVNEKVKLSYEITPQQKQQAQQLYSQYLNTIFPDSKVKDIVYRSGNITKKEFEDSEHTPTDYMDLGTGLYLSPNKKIAEQYGNNPRSIIIDIKNPKDRIIAEEERAEFGKKEGEYGIPKLDSNGKFDGIVDLSQEFNKTYELVVFEPEQIHILGSKQDIESFKDFVAQSSTSVENLEEAKEENLIPLKDGNTYSPQEINSKMLEQMGYSPEEIGKILKSICYYGNLSK